MTAIRRRHWSVALCSAVIVHCAVAAAVVPVSEPKPVRRILGQGMAISLGGSGGMPASAQASKAETVTDAKADAAETASPPVPTARPPDVDTAVVQSVQDGTAQAEPETAESRSAEVAAVAEPVESADVAEQVMAVLEPVPMSAPAAPQTVSLYTADFAKPPRPREKPVVQSAEAVTPAAVSEAAVMAVPKAAASQSLVLRAAKAAEQTTMAPTEAQHPGEDAVQALAALFPGAGDSQGSGTGPSTAVGAEGGSPGERADFFAAVQAWLEQHKRYPRRARMRNETGTVLVRFVLLQDGRVREYEVLESSGYVNLDNAASKMIERAQPMPRIPEPFGQSQLELVVPIAFQLN